MGASAVTASLEHHVQSLRARVDASVGGEPDWMRLFRDRSALRFNEMGLPDGTDEEWRFTPIAPIADTEFSLPERGRSYAETGSPLAFADAPFARLVFVDGILSSEMSSLHGLPREVDICSLNEAAVRHPRLVEPWLGAISTGGPSFTSLNGALFTDGAFIHVPAGVLVETPVHLAFLTTRGDEAFMTCPRALVLVGESGGLSIVETYQGAGGVRHLTNSVVEAVVGRNAELEHHRLQLEPGDAYHIGRTSIRLDRDSRYTSHAVSVGASLSRHDLGAVLTGENGLCTMNGLYVGAGSQIHDSHTVIDHASAHCESHELYKGVLNDRSRGVFNGKVFVRPDAQKTDAKQTNQALLLSDGARVDTKPQLEIFADDVRCTHGATVGQLDADSLFYLRSRGIAAGDARSVLIHAFASEIIDRMRLPVVRQHLEGILLASLPSPSTVFWGPEA